MMPHVGLWSSRHAPNGSKSAGTIQQACSQTAAAQEFLCFQSAVKRLKWKLPYLADSHRKATMVDGGGGAEQRDVETMFKLDFYEYYTVLERALVHLLAVFGYTIEAARKELTHTYHATLLSTLRSPTNPLYDILGTPSVYKHLLSAKQLRNRWKNAEAAMEQDSPPPLKAYEIEEMLMVIFDAFERAEELARRHVGSSGDGELASEEVEMVGYVDEGEEMDWD